MKTENIQKGPCINCGATYYPLSFGGPDICPTCDCSLGAVYHPNYVNVRAERDRLKAVNAEMLEALKRAAPWLGKLIADEVHLKCVNPSDALRTLAMVQIVIGKAEAL